LRKSAHSSVALKVWRGKTPARNRGKVLPQPPLRPRSEQNARWPRVMRPTGAAGSLPRKMLWRFSEPRHPQCGQHRVLSAKARRSIPPRHA
jgi:hypothetical protein